MRESSWLALAISIAGMLGILAWRLLEVSGWVFTAAALGCCLAGVNPLGWAR